MVGERVGDAVEVDVNEETNFVTVGLRVALGVREALAEKAKTKKGRKMQLIQYPEKEQKQM